MFRIIPINVFFANIYIYSRGAKPTLKSPKPSFICFISATPVIKVPINAHIFFVTLIFCFRFIASTCKYCLFHIIFISCIFYIQYVTLTNIKNIYFKSTISKTYNYFLMYIILLKLKTFNDIWWVPYKYFKCAKNWILHFCFAKAKHC